MYLFKKTFNPEIFQGKYRKKNYFEGWYFKIIDLHLQNVLAIIPGISFDRTGCDNHAFVQVLDAKSCMSVYRKYDISCFKFNEKCFEIEIGENFFSRNMIELCINSNNISIHGNLMFKNTVTFPKTFLRPGIMGPFTFVPFMECYHGIVNMHHDICGSLYFNSKEIDFSKGYGYIEKDWGKSFPEAWIWLQSNHFGKDDVSLMFSFAKIPWLGRHFLGLISFIRIKDHTYLFATYTKAKIQRLEYAGNQLQIVLEDKMHVLEIDARHSETGMLKAPKNGMMNREILESITATVRVRLYEKNSGIIYTGEGTNAGLEIESNIFKYFS